MAQQLEPEETLWARIDSYDGVKFYAWTEVQPQATRIPITAASWSGGTATITADNDFAAGQVVTVFGVTPSGYNGTYEIVSASATQFTYAVADPGGAGTVFGDATVSTFIDKPGGAFGSETVTPAYEPNGAEMAVGLYVRLVKTHYDGLLDWLYAAYPVGSSGGGGCCDPVGSGGQAVVYNPVATGNIASEVGEGPGIGGTYNDWTWTVPDCVTEIFVECFGGGGYTNNYITNYTSGGGGGGGYSSKTLTVVPGQVYYPKLYYGFVAFVPHFSVFVDTDDATVLVAAQDGYDCTTGLTGAQGGQTTNAVGDVKYAGGNGGNGYELPFLELYINGGGGGGGGAGPNGNGENGENATIATVVPQIVSKGGAGYGSGGNGQLAKYALPTISSQAGNMPNGGQGGGDRPFPWGGGGMVRITWGTVAPHPVNTPNPTGVGGVTVTTIDGEIDEVGLVNPLPVENGGTGRPTSTTAYGLLAAGTTATGPQQTLPAGTTTEILVGGGASALPVWTAATGSGAPVRQTSPTLVTPNLGTPSAGVLTNCTELPEAGLATGMVLHAAHAGTVLTSENKSGSTVAAGMVVATHSSGTGFVLADGSSISYPAIGVTRASIANTVAGDVQTEGLITLSNWSASTGGATLTARANYFSDPANPGKLTTTVPTTVGYVVQLVGVAVSSDTMDLVLSSPIKL